MSLDEAFAHCARVVACHYENFPVGSRLAPKRVRPFLHSIYAFARAADDFADEADHAGHRLERLDAWEEKLDRCLRGEAEHPVFVALGETIRRCELPDRPLRDLLDAFRQDCSVSRYARWADLLDYCRRSANPVGRLVLHVHGYRDEERARLSDSICTGLQLANFWQDVSVDLQKDRIYLPEEDRLRHGVRAEDLLRSPASEGVRRLVVEMAQRTSRCFEEGRALPRRVGGRLGLELRAVWLGGRRILRKIEEASGDVLARRPTLSRSDRARIVLGALLGGRA